MFELHGMRASLFRILFGVWHYWDAMPHSHPPHDNLPLPYPSRDEAAAFASLCREHYGIVFASEKEAMESLTALLHLYFVLGRRVRSSEPAEPDE